MQRNNKNKIGKIGSSDITMSLKCQLKDVLTFVDQVVSLKALNRKMSFGE